MDGSSNNREQKASKLFPRMMVIGTYTDVRRNCYCDSTRNSCVSSPLLIYLPGRLTFGNEFCDSCLALRPVRVVVLSRPACWKRLPTVRLGTVVLQEPGN